MVSVEYARQKNLGGKVDNNELNDREVFRDVELENLIQNYCDDERVRLDLVSGFQAGKKLIYGRLK